MNNKIILVDCDGVLLDWEHSFKLWMKEKGYEVKNDVEYSMASILATRNAYACACRFDFFSRG